MRLPERIWIKRGRISLLFVLATIGLAACASRSTASPPPSALNIPIFPGASRPDAKDKSQAQDGSLLVITYTVTAAPSTVLGYYDDLLLSDDWLPQDTPDKAANRRFVWSSINYGTMYSLKLDTAVKGEETYVTIVFQEQPNLNATPAVTPP